MIVKEWKDDNVYHADMEHLSASGLKQLRKGPRHFEGYLQGRGVGSKALNLGGMVHAILLDPDAMTTRFQVNDANRNSNAYKDWRRELPAGCVPVKSKEVAEAERVTQRAMKHPVLSEWIKEATRLEQTEQAIAFDYLGEKCRCKIDIRVPGIICDLKTIANADERSIYYAFRDFGYQIQQAHYTRGAMDEFNETVAFAFAFLETSEPYRTLIYELGEDDVPHVFDEHEELVREAKRLRDLGDYSEPEEFGVRTLYLGSNFFKPRSLT